MSPLSPTRDWLGWSMAGTAALGFSLVTPLSKVALILGLNPAMQNVARLVLTAVLLAVTLAFTARGLRIDRRGLGLCLGSGALIGAGALIYLVGLTSVDSSIAAMIFAIEPLLVLGLLALRGERFTYRQYVRLALALTGVYFLVGPGGRVDLLGAGLIALSTFFFALPMAIMQWSLQGYDSRTITFYMVLGMALINLVAWFAQGAPWHEPGAAGWLVIIVLAVVCTYLSRLALATAVKRLGSGQVSLLVPLELLLAVVWSVLFLGERLTPAQWFGGALILTSAALAVVRLRRVPWRATTELP
ncbi:MAG: DMT family transporter [Anaerolineales bacterium]|nr:DMT family transporter [Anaerolineales bacterium]